MTVQVQVTRNCIGGPGKKFVRGQVVELDEQLARKLLSSGSAVLAHPELATESAIVTEDVENPGVPGSEFRRPEIDDDLVVTDEPESAKKSRRKKG